MEFNSAELNAILEAPTKPRSEVAAEAPHPADDLLSSLEFTDEPIVQESEPAPEPEAPYDPVEAAEQLVALIQGANTLSMTPLAMWIAKRKRGGSDEIRKLQVLYERKNNGQKLTEAQEAQVATYTAYLRDKEELRKVIPYTDDEMKMLKDLAIPYCRVTKLKVNSGAAFWSALGGMQLQRIIAILQV